ncbi:MAG: MFS transporter [Oligoflexia bacterium]|nr:MFS transporter [Oligoflexia bacterium]
MRSTFRALKHESFLFVWLATLCSNVGTWMENVGQGWVVASQTHSAFRTELLSFAQFAAVAVLAVPSGILADRISRRKLILFAQVAMCLLAFLLAALSQHGLASANVITAITFFQGAAWVFNGPAWHSVVPHLVPRKDLESAIALNSMQFNLARLLGPALAGFIVAQWGVTHAFYLNAFSFLAVLWAVTKIQIPENRSVPSGHAAPFREGVQWVFSHKGARRVVLSITCFAILGAPVQGLMPFLASDVFQIGPEGLGGLLASLGAGAVVGAYLFGLLPSYYPKHHLIPLSMTSLGALMLVYSQCPAPLVYPVLFILGIFWLWSMIASNTAMQLLAPEEKRGRVMSILIMANVGMLPVGHLIGGFLAHHFGPQKTLLLCAFGMFAVGLITLIDRVPEIDGRSTKARPKNVKAFFNEIILASTYREQSMALEPDSKARPKEI